MKINCVRAALVAVDGDLERAAAILVEGKWLSGCKLVFESQDSQKDINILFTYTATYFILWW